jgi:uncharacterized repeat protein (TIGR03803 family)
LKWAYSVNSLKILKYAPMKMSINNLLLVLACTGLLATPVTAQTFTNLHSFAAGFGSYPNVTNSDGAFPAAGVILSGNTLYGTASHGGTNGNGTVFAVKTDGTGFTNLHAFTSLYSNTNSDGANPYGGLILSGNTLFGTAWLGGSAGNGTVFTVKTDGTGFTNLHSFTATYGSLSTNSDGSDPRAGLLLSGNTLFGTAYSGGNLGYGIMFAINTDGTGFTNLYNFNGSSGANPMAGLILSGNTFYGTTQNGGNNNNGTVFAVNTNGTGFTNLYSFTGGSDGRLTYARLVLLSNTLYGTAVQGGSSGNGTVFAVNTDGTGFTNLHSFTATFYNGYSFTNYDGQNPPCGLLLSGNELYGAAEFGGSFGTGTIFAINTVGTGFTNLYYFTTASSDSTGNTNSDGAIPFGLTLSGNTLYGTAYTGGISGNGTVFSLSYPPAQLKIIPFGTNVNVTWSSSVAGFSYSGYTLQFSTNLVSPAIWNAASSAPVVVNGQNTVTNPISGTQQFFRLSNP